MTMTRFFLFLCLLFITSQIVFAGETLTLYVSTQGTTDGDGSLKNSFLSVLQARDEIRKRKKSGFSGAVDIQIRGGTYCLPSGVRFETQDSGSESSPIVYRAFPGETPCLIGGKTISNFTTHSGSILKSDLSTDDFNNVHLRQLIFQGNRQHLARYPNFDCKNPYGGGWAYAAGKRIPMYQNIENEARNVFFLESEDRRHWNDPEEMEVFVFARYNWWNDIIPIKSVDKTTGRIELTKNASYGIRPGDRFYIRNAFEELDSPGEWYFNKTEKVLYFWPPKHTNDAGDHISVIVPTAKQILLVDQGTSDLVFSGLTFEGSEGTAIVLKDAIRCRVEGCTIKNVGNTMGGAVGVNGGKDNVIYGCDISHVGSTAISLVGGDAKTLTPSGHVAENNYIHHVGVFYKQGVGLSINGVGQRAARNLIHDGPRFACMFGGHNHLIEYNHVRHMNLETSDTGAFYCGGRDWLSARGTKVRGNFIHDIIGYGKDYREKWVAPYHAWGIYLDDNSGGVDIIGNILLRCSRAGINLHNARDNRIENNIIVDGRYRQIEANGWTGGSTMWTRSFPSMVKGYESVAGQEAWKDMRNMNLHPKDAILPDNTIMSGNIITKNIMIYDNPKTEYARFVHFSSQYNTVDKNLIWSGGHPILTGMREIGDSVGKNLVPNIDFKKGRIGGMPEDWGWQTHPSSNSKAGIDESAAGQRKRTLRIDADVQRKNNHDVFPIICSSRIPIIPGKTYRLNGRFRATEKDSPFLFYVHYWNKDKGSWESRKETRHADLKWTDSEQTFTIPKPGNTGHIEGMQNIRISIGFRGTKGSLFVDGLRLFETKTWEDWDAWQRKGLDCHSLVREPGFVGEKEIRSNKNYADVQGFKLSEDSPALKLGFHQIPVERIGPYQDPRRASWPILEIEGAREKPIISEASTH